MRDIEHQHQKDLFSWAEYMTRAYPALRLLYAVPNGGHRDIRVARRLKAEGVKRGVPDVVLPVARGGYHGLYIEMKRPAEPGQTKGRLTDEQRWWIDALTREGYLARCCHGWSDASKLLVDYLDGAIVCQLGD